MTFRVFAQNEDFGIWVDTSVSKKFFSSELSLYNEFYTCNNFSIDRVSIGLGINKSFFQFLNFGAGYLLMNKNKPGNYELRHRAYATTNVKWEIKNFKFSFRERLQITKYPDYVNENSKIQNHWRNRMRLTYDIAQCKIKPAIGLETFVLLNKSVSTRLDEVRYHLSAIYPINNSTMLEVYGLLSQTNQMNLYIMGINYQITL